MADKVVLWEELSGIIKAHQYYAWGVFFFYSRITWLVWNLCYVCLDILSVVPLCFYSHFLQFRLRNVPESVNLGLESIWIVVVSEIWSHRNKILFKDGVLDYSEIFSLAQLKVSYF